METAHGPISTPVLLPVVNPNRPIIPAKDLADRFRAEILITNAYILGKTPTREAVFRGGVHSFLGFPRAVMTGSGGFPSHVFGDVEVPDAAGIGLQKEIGVDPRAVVHPC